MIIELDKVNIDDIISVIPIIIFKVLDLNDSILKTAIPSAKKIAALDPKEPPESKLSLGRNNNPSDLLSAFAFESKSFSSSKFKYGYRGSNP
jgi:hypothetical protein